MKFAEYFSMLRYGHKDEYRGGEILHGNQSTCEICGAPTRFIDTTINRWVCSTECDDEAWRRDALGT